MQDRKTEFIRYMLKFKRAVWCPLSYTYEQNATTGYMSFYLLFNEIRLQLFVHY